MECHSWVDRSLADRWRTVADITANLHPQLNQFQHFARAPSHTKRNRCTILCCAEVEKEIPNKPSETIQIPLPGDAVRHTLKSEAGQRVGCRDRGFNIRLSFRHSMKVKRHAWQPFFFKALNKSNHWLELFLMVNSWTINCNNPQPQWYCTSLTYESTTDLTWHSVSPCVVWHADAQKNLTPFPARSGYATGTHCAMMVSYTSHPEYQIKSDHFLKS